MRPGVLARLILGAAVALPALACALPLSAWRIRRWKKHRTVKRLMERHPLVFAGADLATLHIQALPGGVSNCSFVWHCRMQDGKRRRYVAKLFLPVGSVWAWLLPLLGPYPRIRPVRARERMAADALSRTQLVRCRVPVPEPVLADPIECVVVSKHLPGEPLTDVLSGIGRRGRMSREEEGLLSQCGALLGQIHAAGFSVIDAQPANCLWVPSQEAVYMLDFEYSSRSDERNWDVRLFLAFLSVQLAGPLGARAAELFRQGYLSCGEGNGAVFHPDGDRLEEFLPVFRTVLELRDFLRGKLKKEGGLPMTTTERQRRAKAGTLGGGKYYRIVTRPKENLVTFRYQDVGRPGHTLRLAGQRRSGSWDTLAWLISKEDAHLRGNRLVPETSEAKKILANLGSSPIHVQADIFRARPRRGIPRKAQAALRRRA